ncbi:MAG: Nif3-like dinuclear metal center hexameric protein [Defluviitaleaceae bacterium]|nr:Nif3-like dinuclear metal center hexameric protein [Defluviitaleaceae bacterium]
MKATNLYNQLEKDFVIPGIYENWYDNEMAINDEYICANFKKRSMGLLCDFANDIHKVYTAVFPSDKALTKILDDNAKDAMLFVHHPLAWDLSRDPNIAFYQINAKLLKEFKANNISLFNFHYPLDNYGQYSTSKTLASALGIAIEKPFASYNGAMCGIIGTTTCKDIHELNARYAQAVGHKTKLYQYGESTIKNSRVGVCAGSGNDANVVKELVEHGINVLISGLSVKNKYSHEAHCLEMEHNINLIGGTHYSSEKFACIEICKYFCELGLAAEYINDIPCYDDL